ncbi:MAG TPA: type II secretion system F family protein [Nocardioides sp.]|uniref:type II secretion system F family protein n=1 Tax=Nocardioides sp. TaxID=35761 RepID=UPI002F40FF74
MRLWPEVLLAAALAGLSVAVAVPSRARWPTQPRAVPPRPAAQDPGWLHRWRWLWAGLAGVGGTTFVSGRWGVPVGAFAATATWLWIGRSEPAGVRRRREAAARELPGLVHLLVTALASGCDVAEALRLVCGSLPGPAAQMLAGVPARLALGVPPEAAWRPVLDEPELAPLARAMVRAHRSGASVTDEMARLAQELERRARLRVEEQARAVGVKAAVPLGLCLLPSFLLLGVVPLVVGLLRSLAL